VKWSSSTTTEQKIGGSNPAFFLFFWIFIFLFDGFLVFFGLFLFYIINIFIKMDKLV
jgi:hypothetical protein